MQYTIPYPVRALPSGGIINPGVENYNPNNYYIELEALPFSRVVEYTTDKNKAKTQIEKLGVMIDYLIPPGCVNFPVCDMFAIMTQVSILSGFDIIGDEVLKEKANQEGKPFNPAPYFLNNIVCPSCGKKHDKVSFGLQQISFFKLEGAIISGKVRWRKHITFNNLDDNNAFYKLEMPRIVDFRQFIREFIEQGMDLDLEYNYVLRMLMLASAITKVEENSVKDLKKSISDIKEIINNASGGDAMKLERIYNDILIPPILLNKFCDCKGASSVLDISFIITDVIRLLIDNSRRIIPEIYEPVEDVESGYPESSVQLSNESSDTLRSSVGSVFERKRT